MVLKTRPAGNALTEGPVQTEVQIVGEPESATAIADTQKPQPETDSPAEYKEGPVLMDISFDNVYAKSGEMVLFKLNDFHPPAVSAIEKGQPRIVCDFMDARMHEKIPGEIDAGGKLIEKIRVAKHSSPEKIRVVLDLKTGNDYDLQQVFFKEDNLFVLIVNTLTPELSQPQ